MRKQKQIHRPDFEIDLIDFSRKKIWMNQGTYYRCKRAATLAYLLSAALIIILLSTISLIIYLTSK